MVGRRRVRLVERWVGLAALWLCAGAAAVEAAAGRHVRRIGCLAVEDLTVRQFDAVAFYLAAAGLPPAHLGHVAEVSACGCRTCGATAPQSALVTVFHNCVTVVKHR